ncbi:MAG: LptF/LptG family permease [Ekhidna sp.]|nr:LptF/LptG family permease [Ekhidna sp.]
MKKLDTFMLKAFIGPFVLTTGVATFILLIQYLLKYFDDLVGKNLGIPVFAELLSYFALNMLQNALPLGVLVASLMTFGNLGEHFELTAIKSAGISLIRILKPVFVFVFLVAIGMFFFNNYIIPAANLKAYSLLYDIKETKPALDIKEGAFYNGIPDYSIKVKEKLPDGKTLKDIIIYDHSKGRGNQTIILADSSLMYTLLDDKYLKLELFNGNYFSEEIKRGSSVNQLYRTNFQKMSLVFSLSSFDLQRRKEELFQNNRQMKNIKELKIAVDSFKNEFYQQKVEFIDNTRRYSKYHIKSRVFFQKEIIPLDSAIEDSIGRFYQEKYGKASILPPKTFEFLLGLFKQDTKKKEKAENIEISAIEEVKFADVLTLTDTVDSLKNESIFNEVRMGEFNIDTLNWEHLEKYLKVQGQTAKFFTENSLDNARNIKANLSSAKTRAYRLKRNINRFTIEKEKKYAIAVACILMFMIGAPLGAIIKKGGLGAPVIIAVFFFITYYIIGSIGNQQSKELQLDPYIAAWMSDVVLLPFGLLFLRQARIDARLFEIDSYLVWFEKLKMALLI